MEDYLSNRICDICYKGENVQEREIILYGIQLLVETIFKMILLLMVSVCIGKLRECIEFMLIFCPLRAVAGGFHCRTNLGCTLTFFLIYFVGLVLNLLTIPKTAIIILFVISLFTCLKWAPSTTKNNPITDSAIIIRKKCVSILIICILFLETQYSILNLKEGGICSIVASVTLLIIIQEVKHYVEEKRERNDL